MTTQGVEIDIHHGDAKNIGTDLLVLKYMENAEGVGKEIAHAMGLNSQELEFNHLTSTGVPVFENLPDVGESKLFDDFPQESKIKARNVLYIGVKPAPNFRYQDIRRFARRSLMIASQEIENAEHITLTIHGPGYGLDEREAFESELAGLIEAVQEGSAPPELKRISVVEVDPKRAKRLDEIIGEFIPGRVIERNQSPTEQARSVGYDSEEKPHLFIAMPFDEEFEDVYYLGIEDAVHTAGYLCERIDQGYFTGNITEQIKNRIQSASLVIADLTNANPNVYLEVGYAWGTNVPTLFLTQDTDDLKFDVQQHNTITYDRYSLRKLNDELSETLSELSFPYENR